MPALPSIKGSKMTFQLYIGSNNRTKKLETRKVRSVMASRHDGFTLYPVTGYWKGQRENSLIVLVEDDETKVMATIAILKSALEQEAIGFQQVPQVQFA